MDSKPSKALWQITVKLGNRRGASWPLGLAPLTLGRSRRCDIVIQDPSVSREHCSLRQEAGRVVLEDLASSIPPLVNGHPVKQCALAAGDVLQVGSATFMISRATLDEDDTSRGITKRSTVFPRPLQWDQDAPEESLQDAVRSIWDLHALHNLLTRLSLAGSDEHVAAAILSTLSEQEAFQRCFVLRCGSSGAISARFPARSSIEPPVSDLVRQVCTTGVGVRHTGESNELLAVPISFGGKAIGAIVVETRGNHEDAENSKVFLSAIGRTAAPYFLLVTPEKSPAQSGSSSALVCPEIAGHSPAAEQIRQLAQLAAEIDLPLLLHGETGTGKELVSRLVHRLSERSGRPFIAVNCAAVPEGLFESEFFGHVRGAFTGAILSRKGLIAEAQGGVLFLDEISELSLRNQARFLRVIETGKFRPVGGSVEVSSDFRVISASNQELLALVRQDKFRADLYFRLCGFEISLPPLRSRSEDVPLLVRRFASDYAAERKVDAPRFSPEALEFLARAHWTGNIRELRNVVRRLVAFSADAITLEQVRALLPAPPSEETAGSRIETVEQEHIARVLTQCHGQIAKAAEVLGMHRNTLRRKIRQYGL